MPSSAAVITDVLTKAMGYAGILVSAAVLALFIVFGVAAYAFPRQRRFLFPMIAMFAGGVVDRWITGGALVSSITEIDLSNPEKIVSITARGFIFISCMWLCVNAYRAYSRSQGREEQDNLADEAYPGADWENEKPGQFDP